MNRGQQPVFHANRRLWRILRRCGRKKGPPPLLHLNIPKFPYFKEFAAEVMRRESIDCTFDWRYHSTARFFIKARVIRIGYARLKECYQHSHYIPEWSRGTELCRVMTGGQPLLKARWVILHELAHAKLVDHNFTDAHNKTFYKTLTQMAENHLRK